MRAFPLIAVSLIALSACGQGEEPTAPAAPAPAAEPAPVAAEAPVNLEAACRQAVQVQYGQADADIAYEAPTGTVSWRAPVDGGRLSFSCAMQGAQVALVRDGKTQLITLPTSAAATAGKEAR